MKANGTKQHQRQQFDCAKRQERKKEFRSARSRHSNCNVIVYEWECECVIYNKVKKKCGHNDVFICWVYCHCPDAEVKQKAHALTQREQRKNIDTDNDRKKERKKCKRKGASRPNNNIHKRRVAKSAMQFLWIFLFDIQLAAIQAACEWCECEKKEEKKRNATTTTTKKSSAPKEQQMK